ncbi:hypothetical protein V9T40_012025 [Parthenolecanium corni]|uniref:Phosphoinositide phospholipase C n=1 Tax=Parthenolecanium corni TaxID=536013 RepID=A0AAN9T7X2_9HEMI
MYGEEVVIVAADKLPGNGSVLKMFSQNKEEKKRIEKALDSSGLPSGKNECLNPAAFSFEDFLTFYKNLTQRSELEKIFDGLCENTNSKRKFMSITQFVDFINKTQRDPRLNEILYPYANASRAKDLIAEHEPNSYNAQRGLLSIDGFLRYLMSEDNPIVTGSKLELSEDMDQPLAHYFINSSHNTYLSGHQLTGKSSVEMYRQCLVAGCRCVELDFWNGKTDEPVIVHGYTFVPEIPARDVLEAIAESAFKTSDYPVILSFENHCNPRQQAKIAQYCREFFGEMLLETPLDTHKLEPFQPLPPPSLLKRKIIIKNKKKHHHHKKANAAPPPPVVTTTETETPAATVNESPKNSVGNGEAKIHPSPIRQGSKDSSQENDEDDEDDDGSSTGLEDEDDTSTGAEEIKMQMLDKPSTEKVSSRKETEAGAEISALVNYVQPIHFVSFEVAEKRGRCYEMSSFDEKQALTLLKERPVEFLSYNKSQLSRVYPAGTRFDSSNFQPQVFWNVGCQLVAINYQTLDLAMQLNLGIFEYNGRSGYLMKPEFLRRKDRCLDPFAESTIDGIIANTVSIHVISGQFLSDKRVGTYVEVEMYGLPADTVRKKYRTKIVPNNGINPVYDDEPFRFKKIVLPELASVRIAAYEDSGKMIGHRVLPVVGLCPGFRHVGLRNESGQSLPLATLFLEVVVKDYVPDDFAALAEALANPIKYQSEKEKRAKQLAVLVDDDLDASADPAQTGLQNPDNQKLSKVVIAPSENAPSITSIPLPSAQRSSFVQPSHSSSSETPEEGDAGKILPPAVPQDTKTSPKIQIQQPSYMNDEMSIETFEKLMESKPVKERKAELDRKLDALKRKYDKMRVQTNKQISEPDKTKSKFYKRLSIKSIDHGLSLLHAASDAVESIETEENGNSAKLSRSQSERLLSIAKEHYLKEKELKEQYHEIIFNILEKTMRTSQQNQLKTLRVLLEKETDAVMRRLQAKRREDVKALSKDNKNKDEMTRIKREISSSMVEKGVGERKRLTQLYEKRKEDLEKKHEEVRLSVEEERQKAKAAILREYDEKLKQVSE